jgi:adenylate cyclase
MVLDVAGYTRLMEAEEEETHRRLMRIRSELLSPTVERFKGRVVKELGDGFLATFDSAIDATSCAIRLQESLGRMAADVPPENQVLCRIGLNLADTIIEEHDVFGGGVNIAARLQSYAEPGCIVASASILALVSDQLTVPVVDLGELHLKNLRNPVRAYSLRVTTGASATGSLPNRPDDTRPSIAVLPFRHQLEDGADRYFAEGMVDDIIRALAGLKELFVISRASTLGFGGPGVDAQSAGRQFGVRYMLSGTVHRSGRRLRIGTELSDTITGAVLWAEQHDGDLSELFALQDSIAVRVVGTVAPHVRERELQRAIRKHPESMGAYDLVLQGIDLLYRMEYPTFSRARGLLQQAIVLDPAYAPAYAYAAQWHIHRAAQGWSKNPEADGCEAARLAAAAIELDKYDALGLALYGHARSFLLKDYDAGKGFLDRALVASPNCALAWTLSSCTCTYLGETRIAIERGERGLRLSPLDPLIFFYLHNLGMAHYVNGSYEDAVSYGRKAAAHKRTFRANLRVLAGSLVALGMMAEAQEAAQILLEAQPDFRLSAYASLCPFKDRDIRELFLERLRLAGLPR